MRWLAPSGSVTGMVARRARGGLSHPVGEVVGPIRIGDRDGGQEG